MSDDLDVDTAELIEILKGTHERQKQGLPIRDRPADGAWRMRLAEVQALLTFMDWKRVNLIQHQHTGRIGERRDWARMLFNGVVESGLGRTRDPNRRWALDKDFDRAERILREKARNKLMVEFFDSLLDAKLEETS